MKQQAIDILDEMMEERTPYKEDMPLHKTLWYELCHWWYIALEEAKSRIQALQSGVQTITIPEWTVLLGKDEYESLKEKAWRYDDLSNS